MLPDVLASGGEGFALKALYTATTASESCNALQLFGGASTAAALPSAAERGIQGDAHADVSLHLEEPARLHWRQSPQPRRAHAFGQHLICDPSTGLPGAEHGPMQGRSACNLGCYWTIKEADFDLHFICNSAPCAMDIFVWRASSSAATLRG